MRRSALLLVLVAAAIVPASASAGVPGTHCDVFPANNIWNIRVDSLPVHDMSATWLASASANSTDLHPDFGPPDYGIPFDVVGPGHDKVEVDFVYADENDAGPYPFDARTSIEGGSDHHALIVERGTCRLYELFDAGWNSGNPKAGSGAIFDLDRNRLRPETWTSADAAGLPIFVGLVRWDEVKAGSIRHAIRFTVDCTTEAYVWPARHEAGVADPDCPPMGARFRLKASFVLTGFGAKAKTVPASAFEAVDASACMVDVDSGRADCH